MASPLTPQSQPGVETAGGLQNFWVMLADLRALAERARVDIIGTLQMGFAQEAATSLTSARFESPAAALENYLARRVELLGGGAEIKL
jgi:hypothetical protein